MKRIAITAALLAALTFAAGAYATPSPVASSSPQACDASGAPLVNVHFMLVNDYDSAVGGGSWANDTIDRHLEVWQVGDGVYCSTVSDQGSFVTFANSSPNGTGSVSAGIRGKIKGGYATTAFTGTFDPALPVRGNLGTFDLHCTSLNDCPGDHPSFLSYFASTAGWGFADWGWSYHTAKNGTWINQASGNSGDITG